jgi:Ser/Thr protein kinase RdoA (MazF antagonist)
MVMIPKIGFFGRKIIKFNSYKKNNWDQKEIKDVLDNYNINSWEFLKNLGGGNSDNILIKTNKGRKVLKRYYWSLASTIYEHSILQFLTNKNFSVPRLESNNKGTTYTQIGKEHYAVSDFIEGHCFLFYYKSTKTMAHYVELAGKKLAQLHQLVHGFEAQGRKLNGYMPDGKKLWRGVDWHLKVLEDFFKEIIQDKRVKFLISIQDKLKKKLIELGRYYELPDKEFVKLIIHGDYSPQNILFNNKNISTVLDFGDANLNFRSIDVARGMETFSKTGKFGINPKYAMIFLKSYHEQQRLSKKEIEAIPDLIMWRHLKNIIWSLYSVLESHKNQLFLNEHFAKINIKWKKFLFVENKKYKLISMLKDETKKMSSLKKMKP